MSGELGGRAEGGGSIGSRQNLYQGNLDAKAFTNEPMANTLYVEGYIHQSLCIFIYSHI